VNAKQITPVTTGFESLKQTNEHNAEYWRARDLQPLLGYTQWRRFEQAIERAMASCETSGNNPENQFFGGGEMVSEGTGHQRPGKH
jgi:DNA-damage-inducible protein D